MVNDQSTIVAERGKHPRIRRAPLHCIHTVLMLLITTYDLINWCPGNEDERNGNEDSGMGMRIRGMGMRILKCGNEINEQFRE